MPPFQTALNVGLQPHVADQRFVVAVLVFPLHRLLSLPLYELNKTLRDRLDKLLAPQLRDNVAV